MMDKVVLAKHNKTSLKQVNQNIRLNQLLVALGMLEEKVRFWNSGRQILEFRTSWKPREEITILEASFQNKPHFLLDLSSDTQVSVTQQWLIDFYLKI